MFLNLPSPDTQSVGQICKKCVMDQSDSTITFDNDGVCHYCNHTLDQIENISDFWPGKNSLSDMGNEIRSRNKRSNYDCVIGFSGGLDSSFLVHLAVNEMNLKPLLVHVDAGWNNSTAVSNIKKIAETLDLELHTIVFPWRLMRRLQLSFFKSGLPHLDVPQDAAFFSCLYDYAKKFRVRSVLTGANLMTESIREPFEWGAYPGNDPNFIKSVYEKYNGFSLKGFDVVSSLSSRILYRYFYGMKIFKPLNSLSYKKEDVEKLLSDAYDWEAFRHKHHESRLTKFIEGYWLPLKFNVDRRRAHFSSLILSGNLSRSEALKLLESPSYSLSDMHYDFFFIADKLEIPPLEFLDLMERSDWDINKFNSSKGLYKFLARIQNIFTNEKRLYK